MSRPSGKVWCTCSMCSRHPRKHPQTGVLTNGNLIDRRKHEEHRRRDVVNSIMSTDSPQVRSRTLQSQRQEELRKEEHERISQEILLANLRADFASLSIGEQNIPMTMSVDPKVFSGRDTPIPQRIRQALEMADLKIVTLLAEATEIYSGLQTLNNPYSQPQSVKSAFPGRDLAMRLREMYNTLQDLNLEENQLANRLRLDMQNKVVQKLKELDNYELFWTIRISEHDSLPPEISASHATYDTNHYLAQPMNNADPVLVVAVFAVILVNIFSHVNRSACNLLLWMMQAMVRVAIQRCYPDGKLPLFEECLLKEFPRDVRTARRALDVEPKLTLFASCPRCHYCHTLRPKESEKAFPQYPEYCEQVAFPGEPKCGERLVQEETAKISHREATLKPLRPFYFHDPKEFIASMITRPGMEKLLDNYWERVNRAGVFDMKDLGDGSIIKELLSVEMENGFASTPKEVGRIVFGISIDWFNPYEMRIRGPSVTAGIIVLVCLNLPGHMRYRPENVFPVGVLPGPDEPNLTDINHYFRPMVDSLLDLWSPGIYFRSTQDYPQGRTYRAALLSLIADYPAIRKALGVKISPRAKEHFCTFCDVPRHEIHKWLNTDPSEYPRRTAAEHRAMAYEWRDAATPQAQEDAFKRNGIRYTELLRLPYWDPTRFVVVDPMHNLFLGLIQSHFRGFLGVKVKDDKNEQHTVSQGDADGAAQSSSSASRRAPPPLDEEKAKRLLNEFHTLQPAAWRKKMNTLNRSTLNLICQKLGILVPQFPNRTTKKCDIIDSIETSMQANPSLHLQYDSSTHDTASIVPQITFKSHSTTFPNNDPEPSHPSGSSKKASKSRQKRAPVLGTAEIRAVQQDVARLITPSWVTAIPRNFGEAKAGTLKSDQWRSALNLYLPLTMIRLWGNLQSVDRRKQILDNTMLLLQAIQFASTTTMTEAKAKMYTVCMKSYLKGLAELFPDHALHPNHHMALHIEECLIQFGPIRGWWAFPFERLVGALQHVQTNWKFGELEHTMITSYMAGSNIRIMLGSHRQPEALNGCIESIAEYLGTETLGTLTVETLHMDTDNINDTFQLDALGNVLVNVDWDNLTRLPTQIYHSLCSHLRAVNPDIPEPTPMAVLYRHFTKGGRKYSTSQAAYRDSLVLYKKVEQRRIVPGSIHSVFSRIDGRKSDGTLIAGHYIAVQPFDELKEVTVPDPYRRHGAFAHVCCNKLESNLDIIKPQDIISQFAKLDIESDFMIVIPLRPA